jgi:hypothetical protein
MVEPAASTDPAPSSPEEHERRQVAQRHGDPYLLFRTAEGDLKILTLPGSWDQVNVGRSTVAEVSLHWDPRVSRVHAQLERVGDDWAVVDDGLSSNGSFLNGERITGRRRLSDGDELRFGQTRITFHAPLQDSKRTLMGEDG